MSTSLSVLPDMLHMQTSTHVHVQDRFILSSSQHCGAVFGYLAEFSLRLQAGLTRTLISEIPASPAVHGWRATVSRLISEIAASSVIHG